MNILKLTPAFLTAAVVTGLAVTTLKSCNHPLHVDDSQSYCKADFTRRSAGIYDVGATAPRIAIQNAEVHSDGVMEGVPDHAIEQLFFVYPDTKTCEVGNGIAGYIVFDLK